MAQKAYDIKLADYKEKKRLYDEAQAAYLIDNELYKKKKRNTMMLKMPSIRWLKSVVETPEKYKQDLTFLPEELADGETTTLYHQTTGLTTYLTKEGQSRLYGDGKATKMYETKNLQDSDLTTTNPYADNEIEWAVVKVGDKFDVTYKGLRQANIKEGRDIKRILKWSTSMK